MWMVDNTGRSANLYQHLEVSQHQKTKPMSTNRKLTRIQKNIIAANAQWKCGICSNSLPPCFEIDHIVPFCLIRKDVMLWALCANCHGTKSLLERAETSKLCRIRDSLPPTSRLCVLCHRIVSNYFVHHCDSSEEAHRQKWRRLCS